MKNSFFTRRDKWKKIYLFLLLFFVMLGFSPAARAQISISLKNATLKQAIVSIEKQSDYHFFYDDQLARLPVKDLKTTNKNLKETLNILLKDMNVSYVMEEKIVYLSAKDPLTAPMEGQQEIQQRKQFITGTVVDEKHEPLIGVSIAVIGSNIGTVTDADGNYRIEVISGQTSLQFSYIGYFTQTVAVGNKTVIDLVMREDVQVIGEVVVTALGIKREKKLLGYSIQEIKSDDLNQTGNASTAGALQGKIAGIQMNIAPTGLNGSTKITIRGNSSFTDNNQPLWVVDGIPYGDDSDSSVSLYGGIDRGGTAIDINPEDIETISVLKGPNAAALYGSRAGNGVILVTTKKGTKSQGFGVNYNSAFTWSSVAETLKMQTIYGQGLNGVFDSGTPFSYGPKLDGKSVPAWWKNDNNAAVPYSLYGNKLKDYFNTGFSQNHTLAIGNVTEDSHYRLSFGYLNSSGFFEGEKLKKYNIDLNSGKTINPYLSFDSKISLSNTRADNRPYIGKYGEMFQLMYLPNNINLNDLRKYYSRKEANQFGQESYVHQNWLGPTQDIMNPYWIHNRRSNMDERWRVFGYHSMKINFTDWLYATGKLSADYFRTKIEETDRGLGGNVESILLDDLFTKKENNFVEMNAEFLFRGNNPIGEKIRVDYGLGGNAMYQNSESLAASARNMAQKGNWYINNAGKDIYMKGGIPTFANQYLIRKRINSLFGMFQMAYNDYVSLDITGRNDWSSTLTKSYFYPSFSLSFIGTEWMRKMGKTIPDWLTYAKLRASYAKAGKDTEPYALRPYYHPEQSFTGPQSLLDNVLVDSNLVPEMNTSYEAGLEMKFFNNRLGFDFTIYRSLTKNQIMFIPHDKSTGYDRRRINAGNIQNQGLEFAFYSVPLRTKDWEVGLDFNMAHNLTTVKKLNPDVKYVDFGDGVDRFFFTVGAVEGGKLGDIYATRVVKRDENGNPIINKYTGLPELDGSKKLEERAIGNIQPKLTMSAAPRLSYKNVFVSALIDMKFGGNIISVSDAIATHYGTSKRTENRNETFVLKGVYTDGTPNTTRISYEDYYRFIGNTGTDAGVAEEFVFDASYVKFRELALGYSIGRDLLKNTPFSICKFSFVARNLCYLLKRTPGTNPEGGFSTSMYSQAFDYLAIPDSRTLGFSINVSF
ncbi:MAG: SusC/RagA family TonB-linked outer membrane protein [Candidatus Azobacteroides sp.]|nr:SusC/RagA family TonB-linked outer membrane protein [Candidatus Azobacteroides sp.]